MIKSGIFLGCGNIGIAAISLLRNILIARLLGVEDFGIASALALTVSLIEMISQLGINRFIVQAADGDERRFCETCHAIMIIRGLAGGLVLFLIASPMAMFFGVDEAIPAFQALALVPVIRGFVHLDYVRLQRSFRFGPTIVTEFLGLLGSLILAVLLSFLIDDYWLMLYVLFAQSGFYIIGTHIAADRRYSLSFDRSVIARAFRFGWPLIPDSLIVFLSLQGDRAIVGGLISTYALGLFGAAFGLIVAGAAVISRTLDQFFSPFLAAKAKEPDAFAQRFQLVGEANLLAGLTTLVLIALFGPFFFVLLYGAEFQGAVGFIVWMGLAQGIRITRGAWTVSGVSLGDTKIVLISNALRLLTLPPVIVAVLYGTGVGAVLAGALAAEAMGAAASIWLLRRKLNLPVERLRPALIAFALGALVVAVDGWFRTTSAELADLFNLRTALGLAIPVLALFAMPALRKFLRAQINRLAQRTSRS